MEKTKFRQFELPRELEVQIEKHLQSLNIKLSDSKKIADAILRMSDYYIQNPDGATPWKESWAVIAQLAYYLPLNHLRTQAVVEEAKRLGFFEGLESASEIGSGLGALTGHLGNNFAEVTVLEIAEQANQLHKKVFSHKLNFVKKAEELSSDLLAMSYVLTELHQIEKIFPKFKALMIVEPSTSEDSRYLLEVRQRLLDKGYFAWAPCTHQQACPMLTESKKDWCHDRIHLKMPEWFLKVEALLPFKNKTVTFSYLLARKDKAPEHAYKKTEARLIGDQLPEKGKTRILICRQNKKEFLSWLTKDKIELELYRGDVIDLDFPIEEKSNELRILKK